VRRPWPAGNRDAASARSGEARLKATVDRVLQWEEINFLLTNRIPRRLLTRLLGWWSGIEQPLVRDLSIAAFRFFAEDLALHEARKTRFDSLHDCFIRELKEGARPIEPDPAVVVSPCDGVVGASGAIRGRELIQAKGFAYSLEDLLHDPALVRSYTDGSYVTLRLKASMYHRFHAPHDCRLRRVTYISGDTWNVNPIAVRRIEKLFCRNERVVLSGELLSSGQVVTLVAVAAVLVASVRLPFLDTLLHLDYRGPNVMSCDAHFRKGEEIGWFQHGSTIIVFAPPGLKLCPNVVEGKTIRMGHPLLRLP
jgi:phosphatidylserine decarboxylase